MWRLHLFCCACFVFLLAALFTVAPFNLIHFPYRGNRLVETSPFLCSFFCGAYPLLLLQLSHIAMLLLGRTTFHHPACKILHRIELIRTIGNRRWQAAAGWMGGYH